MAESAPAGARTPSGAPVPATCTAADVLVAEQTGLDMFVGVTVGLQLAHELQRLRRTEVETPTETQEP